MASSDLFLDENSKESFLQQLPELLVSARQTWNKISEDQWSDVSLTKLYDLITDITSLSALHDIDETHSQSLAIQEYLKLFLKNSTPPSKKQVSDINDLFNKMEDAQQHNQIALLHTMEQDLPVLLFSNQGTVIPRIEPCFKELGINPILTNEIGTFVNDSKPGAGA